MESVWVGGKPLICEVVSQPVTTNAAIKSSTNNRFRIIYLSVIPLVVG
jgi:hypothetical protein